MAMAERVLVLMRHAKSSWATADLDDHARPLNRRGEADAPSVAAALTRLGVRPDGVVSSDALRTRQTWQRMAAAWASAPEVRFERGLYLGGLGELRQSAASWPAAWQTVLALGHNPGWEQAAALLCGQADELTTANAVVIAFHGQATWGETLRDRGRLIAWLRPRDLADETA